jgi:hypothetical protein
MFLLDVLAAAADGQLPPPDGQVEVYPGLPGKAAAHHDEHGRPWRPVSPLLSSELMHVRERGGSLLSAECPGGMIKSLRRHSTRRR